MSRARGAKARGLARCAPVWHHDGRRAAVGGGCPTRAFHRLAAFPRARVRKTVLAYGIAGGVLIVALRLAEYRFLVVEHALEVYGGVVAAIFAALGLWLGLRLTRPAATVVVREVPVQVPVTVHVEVPVPIREPFVVDPAALERLGITGREHEILALIAAGLSNREIGERLYVSENTVKTHASRLFTKLGARRRTEAVQRAKAAGILA